MTGIGIGAGLAVVGSRKKGAIYSPLTESIYLNEGGTSTENVYFSGISTFSTDKYDPFSAGVWVKYTAVGTFWVMSKYAAGSNIGWYMLDVNDGAIRIRFRDGSYFTKDYFDTDVNDNNWHLLVLTYDGSASLSGVNLYKDGQKRTATGDDGGSIGGNMTNSFAVQVGAINSQGTAKFQGKVVHNFAYTRELSESEVTAIYGGGVPQDLLTICPTGLILWCPLGDGCTNNVVDGAIDISGNDNHGYWVSTTRDVSSDVPP